MASDYALVIASLSSVLKCIAARNLGCIGARSKKPGIMEITLR